MKKKEYIYPEMEIISLTGLFMGGMAGRSDKGEPEPGAPPRTAFLRQVIIRILLLLLLGQQYSKIRITPWFRPRGDFFMRYAYIVSGYRISTSESPSAGAE